MPVQISVKAAVERATSAISQPPSPGFQHALSLATPNHGEYDIFDPRPLIGRFGGTRTEAPEAPQGHAELLGVQAAKGTVHLFG